MTRNGLIATCFVCLLIAGTGRAHGLDPSRHISQYAHTSWRIQDGVFSGTPNAIAQTTDGYLWIGTQNGLLRFDGVRFVPWEPPAGQQLPYASSAITSLLGARDGGLWIGTNAGLSHWKNGELINYPGPVAYIDSILEDRSGTTWLTRSRIRDWSGPLCQVLGRELRCYGTKDGISAIVANAIFEDSEGYLWMGGTGELIRWKGKLAGVYPLKGANATDGTRLINGVVMTQDHMLLAGVVFPGPGLGLQQLENGHWRPFIKHGLNGPKLEVNAMFLDRDQSIWVGTINQGIYRIHGEVVDHFGRADGLSGDFIQSFSQDREGDIWIATDGGLDVFRDLRIANFTTREGLTSGFSDSVVSRRDGSVWCGTQGALDFLPTGKTSFSTFRKNLPGRQVRALLEDHAGNLWVGVDSGIYVYRGGRFTAVLNPARVADKSRQVISFAEDSSENIWAVMAGTNAVLVRIHDFHVSEEIPPTKVPPAFSVVPDLQGGIWISLFSGDLVHYRHGTWQTISLDQMPAGIPRQRLFNILVDPEGTVWGAAGRGVAAFRDGRLKLLTEQNGLPCGFTYSLVMDLHRALWVYSQCGLTRISSTELHKFWEHPESQIKVEHFGTLDGAQPGFTGTHPGVARSSDGRLWFDNGVGLQMMDPDHFVPNSEAPPVHVEQLVVDHKKYLLSNGVTLPALTRDIEIDYTALSFVMPQRVSFRYVLEGRDTTWQDPGTRRQAFYSDLRPGNYRFRVIASNNDGVWNNEGAALNFKVAAAWFQTSWFRVVCIGISGLLVWMMYELRVRHLRRQFAIGLEAQLSERTRIARELHDTLLQSFNALLLRLQATADLFATRPEEAKRTLDSTIDQTAQALIEGRDAVQQLRSTSMATNDIVCVIGSLGQALADGLSGDAPAFHLEVEGTPQDLLPVTRDEIYRIACEALRNAFRHARARRIEVDIRYDRRQLRLQIRDDGRGIDPQLLRTDGFSGHYGLRGMRERAQSLGGELTIWSEVNSGTEIDLTVPSSIAYTKPGLSRLRILTNRRQARS
jgi:signal transduction histidine kinase/ligand-binding sensor domain-containing protein